MQQDVGSENQELIYRSTRLFFEPAKLEKASSISLELEEVSDRGWVCLGKMPGVGMCEAHGTQKMEALQHLGSNRSDVSSVLSKANVA